MLILLILYAGIIPLVPLLGAEKYKRRGDRPRRNVCLLLFGLQLILSASYVITYLSC